VSARRAPSAAPLLDGFEPIELIGSGGYADVFLYEQQMPRRQVAVKVLVGDVVAEAAFTAEANLMARVSAHPYIVGIYEARVSGDGRPYLVMEYYPGDNYLDRSRRERFSIADALRVGIQVAGAVETAHRAGILHRDIKPANILTSEYGRPGLTDFGIASAEGPGEEEADGVSIPWSPPEAFGQATLDARADVYSLAATLYHLLAGRSPFEVVGGRNGPLDLMARIERDRLPAIGRTDVPASLERLLAHAMAKDPAHRPASAAELARSLQAVENELRLAVTALEVPDVSRVVRQRDDTDDDATRVRGVTEIDAQPTTDRPGPERLVVGVPTDGIADATISRRPARAREGLLAEPDVADTVHRAPASSAPAAESADSTRSRTGIFVGGAAAAVIALAGLAFVMFGGGGGSGDAASATTVFSIGDGGSAEFRGGVDDLAASVDAGTVTFTWTAPDAEPGDEYVYELEVASRDPVTARTEDTVVTVTDVGAGQEACIDVVVTRTGAMDSASRRTCITP